ncbi:hypothetical protein ACVXG7_17190 [Enterobacter hormaechei]
MAEVCPLMVAVNAVYLRGRGLLIIGKRLVQAVDCCLVAVPRQSANSAANALLPPCRLP